MEPYIQDESRPMGGTKEAFQDMLKKDKKAWSELKRKTRREKRRLDKQKLKNSLTDE